MAGVADEAIEALAGSGLPEGVQEVVLRLLRDGPSTGVLADGDLGPIHLRSVEVEGFRGIGPMAKLEVPPGNGLTLVVGPNGCGKSSFAEAVERVLTGTTRRWETTTTDARANWRNVHRSERTAVRVALRRARDVDDSTISLEWGADDDFSSGARLPGGPRRGDAPSWLTADWTAQLELYPPLLPYSELGAVVAGKPSDMFDTFDRLLGLGAMDDAARAAHDAAREARGLLDAVKKARAVAIAACDASSDDEVRAMAQQFAQRSADPHQLIGRVLLDRGVSDDAGLLDAYHRLADVDLVAAERLLADLAAIEKAMVDAERSRSTAAAAAVDLLSMALEWHTAGRESICPVCGQGTLDDAWRDRAQASVNDIAGSAAEASALRSRRRGAHTALLAVLPVPPAIAHPEVPSSAELLAEHRSIVADLANGNLPADALDRVVSLAGLVESCRAEASARRDTRADALRPVVEALSEWARCDDAASGAADVALVNTKAKEWLRAQIQSMRDARLERVSTMALQLWGKLRSTSTIDLGPITLNGANTRRRVDLTCTTEGADAKARAVLSQGELHAVALSLFLPRALHADSPFGFLLIDDPVQAFDRMKVDGLAEVLHEIAQQKQVIVFTHDDRLPDAMSRLGFPATVLRVERGPGSSVSVSTSDDPAARALRDAKRLLRDAAELDPRLVARAVAGCCRAAVEARALRLFRTRAARQGKSVEEIDHVLTEAGSSIWNRVSLAVEGEVLPELSASLRKRGRTREVGVITRLNAGGHDRDRGAPADPQGLLDDTRWLLDGMLAP